MESASDLLIYKSLYDSNTTISWKVEFSGHFDVIRRRRGLSGNFISYIPSCNDCLRLNPELTKCMHFEFN